MPGQYLAESHAKSRLLELLQLDKQGDALLVGLARIEVQPLQLQDRYHYLWQLHKTSPAEHSHQVAHH